MSFQASLALLFFPGQTFQVCFAKTWKVSIGFPGPGSSAETQIKSPLAVEDERTLFRGTTSVPRLWPGRLVCYNGLGQGPPRRSTRPLRDVLRRTHERRSAVWVGEGFQPVALPSLATGGPPGGRPRLLLSVFVRCITYLDYTQIAGFVHLA